MVYFMMTLSNEIFETHPQDVHRPGGPKFDYSRSHRFLHNAWSLQMLFPYFSYSCIGFWLGPFKKIFCNLTGGSGMSMHHLEPSQSCLQSMGRAKCQIPWTRGWRRHITNTGKVTTAPDEQLSRFWVHSPKSILHYIIIGSFGGVAFFGTTLDLRLSIVGPGITQTSLPSPSKNARVRAHEPSLKIFFLLETMLV